MKKIILLLMAVGLFSCTQNNEPKKVKYEIGCSDCTVVYTDHEGTQYSEYHQNSTWTKEVDGLPGTFLLFAYNTSGSPQGVTARIKVNGATTTEQTNYCPISGYVFVGDTLQ